MRSLRQLAALGMILAPLSLALTGPAHAGGGAGMTLTATLDHLQDPDPRFLAGTRHTVFVTVADDPGEASLRQIRIDVADLDPADFEVTCDAGVNGAMSLEPHQSLNCTAGFPAEVGLRTIVVTAVAQVPGLHPETRMRSLHYTGFMPPPPPPVAHAALIPPHHSAPLISAGAQQADPPPKPPIMAAPPGSLPAGLPLGAIPVAGDPPVLGDPPAIGDPPASGSPRTANCPTGPAGAAVGAAGSSCCPAGAGSAGSASCCPGSSGSSAGSGSSATACPSSPGLKAAGQSPFRLALTGTDAPYLGAAALTVVLSGAGLLRLGRIRAARR